MSEWENNSFRSRRFGSEIRGGRPLVAPVSERYLDGSEYIQNTKTIQSRVTRVTNAYVR
jgi:hypothetical protein